MPLTNAGRNHFAKLVVNDGLVAADYFNNANARIGVGDSNTAFAAGQTDLQAATNKFRKEMDGSYPQRATNVLTFRSTFTTSEANFAWEEWGIFNHATAGVMLSRKVESLGTKPSSQSWQFTTTLTITAS